MKVDIERIKKGMWWDRAWSLVEGCMPVSEGCNNCWSAAQTSIRSNQKNEKITARYEGLTDQHGKWTGRIRLMWDDLKKPLHVKKPTTWAIWNDLFHPGVPFEFVDAAFSVISDTPRHTYVLLTKRPGNMARYFNENSRYSARKVADIQESEFGKFDCDMLFSLDNLVLGVTAENQRRADERIPVLFQIPAAARVVSIEPMIGAVDLEHYIQLDDTNCIPKYFKKHWWRYDDCSGGFREGDSCYYSKSGIDWVICGGESGHGARPMRPDWPRSLRDQCHAAKVPYFFKQWGEWLPYGEKMSTGEHCVAEIGSTVTPDESYVRVGKKKAGRLLAGREWNNFPEI